MSIISPSDDMNMASINTKVWIKINLLRRLISFFFAVVSFYLLIRLVKAIC